MKSVPSIACLTCWLAPCMVNSFSSTSLRIPQLQTIIRPATSSVSGPNNSPRCTNNRPQTSLMGYGNYGNGRSSPRRGSDRTKRQERVGHVVRSELATVLGRDTPIRNDGDPIESELRRRINVVHVDVSPDLRQARITVSIMGGGGKERRRDDVAAKRRAYAWLVRNTKSIRYALARRMKHMKGGSPVLNFVQVDVGAAVDVMQLIEKVSDGYKRDDVLEMEFEDDEWDGEEEDDGWFDFDEDGEGVSVEVEV